MRRHAKASSAGSTSRHGKSRGLFGLVCLCALSLVAFTGSGTPSAGAVESFPGQGFLPDNRVWELVSPPDKNGGDLISNSTRTRAATDGSAVQFTSLVGFADSVGSGFAFEYLAQRSSEADPGNSGWSTHAITPPQDAHNFASAGAALDSMYVGAFSDDLSSGLFQAWTALTDAPNVAEIDNIYLRDDLRTPGAGSYRLVSDCLACTSPIPGGLRFAMRPPSLAGASADFNHLLFESYVALTADATASIVAPNVYEWEQGDLRLAGILPNGNAAPASIAGSGARETITSHPISADGSRAIFTTSSSNPGQGNLYMRIGARSTIQLNSSERAVPTSPQPARYWDASTDASRVFFTSQESLTESAPDDGQSKLYMWERQAENERQSVSVDATGGTFTLTFNGSTTDPIAHNATAAAVEDALEALSTVKAENVTVSGGPGSGGGSTPYEVSFDGDFAGANIAQMSADGAGLTGGAATATVTTSQAVENLSFLNVDGQAASTVNSALNVIGASDDGHYVYFVANGQLVEGQPEIGTGVGIYLWHDGVLSYVGPSEHGLGDSAEMSNGTGVTLLLKQARVTPDGKHLLFNSTSGKGLLSLRGGVDYDQSVCTGSESVNSFCRGLYVYSTEDDILQCASCNPSSTKATASAVAHLRGISGGAANSTYLNHPLSANGRYVFFSTAEKLVQEDGNGVSDAYLYDTAAGKPRLLSSGESKFPSYFLDASPEGRDAFFVTAERLSGWDVDDNYDLYDARVDGGFPEPDPPPPSCQGDACQPAPLVLNDPTPTSSSFQGEGDRPSARKPSRRCGKGQRRVKTRAGRARCVKKQDRKRHANPNRRTGR